MMVYSLLLLFLVRETLDKKISDGVAKVKDGGYAQDLREKGYWHLSLRWAAG